MKRILLTLFLVLLVVLVACDRYPGQRVDAPREQPGASIQEYKEATTDDQLLDNTIPGTNDNLGADTAPAATGAGAVGVADPVDPGVDATSPDTTATDTTATDTATPDTADTQTTDGQAADAPEIPIPDLQNVSPDPVGAGSVGTSVETTPVDAAPVAAGAVGVSAAGASETAVAETGGTVGVTTGSVETGGAEVGAETGGAETGGAASDEAGDLDLIDQTSTALEDANTAQAVAVIEAWQTRLASLDDADAAALNDDLTTLKTELQADPVDASAVRSLLYQLGVQTSRLALAAPQDVGDALKALGTALSEAGEASDLATAPVSVDGAMPAVAQSTSNAANTASEVTTVRPDVSPPEAPGALDMNLQTGTVERDDSGVLDASLALPTKVEGATTPAEQTAQTAETGGTTRAAESGGAETGGASQLSETGGAESGAENGGVNEAAAQENVTSSQAAKVTAGELLASAQLKDTSGNQVGVVNLVSSAAGLIFEFGLAEGATLEPGEHGFHVHETGSCTPDFAAAGGHLNPGGGSHGLLNADGPHAGDLPNLVVTESGSPTYVVTTTRVSKADLFDDDGSAVVIHADPDDYVTDPSGNSSDRVACGVLERVAFSQ